MGNEGDRISLRHFGQQMKEKPQALTFLHCQSLGFVAIVNEADLDVLRTPPELVGGQNTA